MKHLKPLVLMQLKDKLDLSFLKTKRDLLIKIILSIVKFVAVAAICFLIFFICERLLGIYYAMEIPQVMVFIISVFFALSVVSCTAGLMKSMFFADDNKVLVTFPVSSNMVFVSKLIVFYIYELKRSCALLFPMIVAFGAYAMMVKLTTFVFFVWMIIPLLLYAAIPVLVGALLSIPTMFVYRLSRSFPYVSIIALIAVGGAVIFGIVKLIAVIPENIDLVNTWPTIKRVISTFLVGFERKISWLSNLVYILIGEKQSNMTFAYVWLTVGKLGILIGGEIILFFAVFFITKYAFYKMMTKSFEFLKKPVIRNQKNRRYSKKLTFFIKEMRLNFRSMDVLLTFLIVYIALPIMIFLLNKVFSAMNTAVTGNMMAYAFNMLIILLPLLAANGMIATLYSREGRAAYMKKTKPISIASALVAKIAFCLVASIPSVLVTVLVFNSFNGFGAFNCILLFIGVLFLNYGHMFWCVSMDIMNPQNEQYATTGESMSNPNESLATITAFIISIVFAIFSYMLFSEANLYNGDFTSAFVKIALIGLGAFALTFTMFLKNVKAFYLEK